jgi:foldase protein PrsA
MSGAAFKACVLSAVALGAAGLGGCGGDESVPSDGVAKVGDTVVERSDFDKWLRVNARGLLRGGRGAAPDPPEFSRCVAAKRRQRRPKGAAEPNAAQLKTLCKQEYEQLKRLVMEFLIEAEWVKREADAQGVKVSKSEINRYVEAQKSQVFPNAKAYEKYLKSSGMTEDDLRYRMTINALQQKLKAKVLSRAKVKEPSAAEVRRFYRANKQRFARPEVRTLNVVLTKTRGEAQQAMTALQAGQSFKEVAERFSIDEQSKRQGGRLVVAEGRGSIGPGRAAFQAQQGELQGPIKTPSGYYIFEVTKVAPASKPSFDRVKQSVRAQLRVERQQRTVARFDERLEKKYREETVCADAFKVPKCKNGPKETTGDGSPSGGPGGQGAQPRPQSQPGQPPTQ